MNRTLQWSTPEGRLKEKLTKRQQQLERRKLGEVTRARKQAIDDLYHSRAEEYRDRKALAAAKLAEEQATAELRVHQHAALVAVAVAARVQIFRAVVEAARGPQEEMDGPAAVNIIGMVYKAWKRRDRSRKHIALKTAAAERIQRAYCWFRWRRRAVPRRIVAANKVLAYLRLAKSGPLMLPYLNRYRAACLKVQRWWKGVGVRRAAEVTLLEQWWDLCRSAWVARKASMMAELTAVKKELAGGKKKEAKKKPKASEVEALRMQSAELQQAIADMPALADDRTIRQQGGSAGKAKRNVIVQHLVQARKLHREAMLNYQLTKAEYDCK